MTCSKGDKRTTNNASIMVMYRVVFARGSYRLPRLVRIGHVRVLPCLATSRHSSAAVFDFVHMDLLRASRWHP